MPSAPHDLSDSPLTQRHSPQAGAAPADALFASTLQRSDKPSPGQVRQAIAAAVAAYGGSGCTARVAQAFGEHPETAVTRMRWARAMAACALPAARPAA